jgi:F-type H+-transporting ATPase subunit b
VSLSAVLQNPEFWVLLALLVVAFILWRAKAPGLLTKALDDAAARVQAQLDEAQRLRDEAMSLLAQIKVQRAETERAAAELMKIAREDAERFRAEAAQKLEEDIRLRALMAERKIALAEAQAAGEVKAAAAELAAQAAEAVLTARLAGARSDPLIDLGLSRLAARFS